MSVQIQLRRDTAANWQSANPVLADGEVGLETDTRNMKVGNGITAWNSLFPINGTGEQFYIGSTIPNNTSSKYVWFKRLQNGNYDILIEDGI